MSTDGSLELTVGQLQGAVEGLRGRVVEIQKTLEGQDQKLDVLLEYRNQSRGVLAVTKTFVGLVASGGFLGWIWEHFHK